MHFPAPSDPTPSPWQHCLHINAGAKDPHAFTLVLRQKLSLNNPITHEMSSSVVEGQFLPPSTPVASPTRTRWLAK